MNKLNVLIVEDEGITAESLSDVLEELGYGVSGIAADAFEAIDILNNDNTDFAILDINIQGDKDGIWVADLIQRKYNIPFIFLTAFDSEQILSRAVETKPYGYLLKPFTKIDISAAIQLAMQNFALNKRAETAEEVLTDETQDPFVVSNVVYIKDDYMFKKLVVDDIVMLKSDGHYVEIHTTDKKQLVRSTLKDFTEILPDKLFVRTHRSHVVNVNYIDKFSHSNVFVKGLEVPISTAYRDDLMKKLQTF